MVMFPVLLVAIARPLSNPEADFFARLLAGGGLRGDLVAERIVRCIRDTAWWERVRVLVSMSSVLLLFGTDAGARCL